LETKEDLREAQMSGITIETAIYIDISKKVKVKVKVKFSLGFLTEHHALKAYLGSGGIAPRILDLLTRWR
jgi:imidazoleglycerol phosphate dehydratase HisB